MFLLLCILFMWLMIFGLCCFYFGALDKKLSSHIIFQFVYSALITSLIWYIGGYGISFKDNLFWSFSPKELSLEEILSFLFQLCFCLYAVQMLIGSIIDRVQTKKLMLTVSLWILFVYCPLAYLIWNPHGFLYELGVKDFSGGMVVHLSAGLSSYLLAYYIGGTPHQHKEERDEWTFIGMIFVTSGWFGFNAGPVGVLNQAAGQVLLNTLLAIISGAIAWTLADYLLYKRKSASKLLNGMVVGLVTSTSAVGYVNSYQMLILTFLASLLTYLLSLFVARKWPDIDDVVDSFAMNGLGGCLGSLGTGLIFFKELPVQLLAICLTIFLSLTVTSLLGRVILRK
ncbi:ammonium transporter [Streptococcus catagoni]|uniref:ammonium transporter n=1 Tax=Streptococcus catagoni TaxID=2654874 RepID=UPI001407C2E2|nr:ammonium transporter [Streptococcus catagoni]